MKLWIIGILLKTLTIENISAVAAKCIVWLLEYARKRGDKYWDAAKNVIRKINNWCSLFLEVYEDDTLTPEEEAKIAEAIKNQTDVKTIVKILQKSKRDAKREARNKKRNAKKEMQEVRQLSVRLERSNSIER